MYEAFFYFFAAAIGELPGPVVDTSCGSGHMLSFYKSHYDPERSVLGIDLSPRIVDIARARLGAGAQVEVGDMRELTKIPARYAAAVLSRFLLAFPARAPACQLTTRGNNPRMPSAAVEAPAPPGSPSLKSSSFLASIHQSSQKADV